MVVVGAVTEVSGANVGVERCGDGMALTPPATTLVDVADVCTGEAAAGEKEEACTVGGAGTGAATVGAGLGAAEVCAGEWVGLRRRAKALRVFSSAI